MWRSIKLTDLSEAGRIPPLLRVTWTIEEMPTRGFERILCLPQHAVRWRCQLRNNLVRRKMICTYKKRQSICSKLQRSRNLAELLKRPPWNNFTERATSNPRCILLIMLYVSQTSCESADAVRQQDRKEHTRNFEHCRQHEVESRREVFAILATRFVLHHKHHFRERLWKNVDQT